ncbi:MAG: ribonuclease HII [Candidatus Saccharibacteria bacterium]|nr:ribonuclease HII [Candidatus Saccharibacteria bacterium]
MSNSQITIGIDEVGRGPWAGPLCVGAVALDMNQRYDGLADSKALTKKKRDKLDSYIKQRALGIGLGWVNPVELDRLGMTASLKLAAQRAFLQLPVEVRKSAGQIVIDGNIQMLDDERVIVLVKADAKVQAVSAASIVAKVARDNYMAQLGMVFPDYNFAKHVGYGTKVHMEALAKHGVLTGVHRASFAPIKKLLGEEVLGSKTKRVELTAGRIAEQVAADYLTSQGYKVIAWNWRTKLCEIDIIATKNDQIFFAEVKYRERSDHGDGLEAITPQKLQQIKFAAELFLHSYPRMAKHYNPRLLAVALRGAPPIIDKVVLID